LAEPLSCFGSSFDGVDAVQVELTLAEDGQGQRLARQHLAPSAMYAGCPVGFA